MWEQLIVPFLNTKELLIVEKCCKYFYNYSDLWNIKFHAEQSKNLNLLKLACNCDKKQAIVYPLLLKRWMEYSCKDMIHFIDDKEKIKKLLITSFIYEPSYLLTINHTLNTFCCDNKVKWYIQLWFFIENLNKRKHVFKHMLINNNVFTVNDQCHRIKVIS